MKPYDIDVAVLIIFFCRDEQLEKVFEQVKRARPSKLYLYQDGARLGRLDDEKGIAKCRVIVDDSQIDWQCEVHRLYQEKNYGCDPSEYIAQKWMFKHEEMGIILEDDDVPSQSFFPFCKELLEKYKDDKRINMICGMNNTGVSKHCKASYLFTKKGSIWGWASWRRVIDTWDGEYTWLNDPHKMEIIKEQMGNVEYNSFIKTATAHKNSGREHYESILAASCKINKRLNIVPKYNMISNIGIAQESTHSVNDIRLLPKKVQRLLYMQTYEIDFPLRHPKDMKNDLKFERQTTFSHTGKILMKIETFFRILRYQGISGVVQKVKRRI